MGVVENISRYIPFISQGSDGTGREPPDIKELEPSFHRCFEIDGNSGDAKLVESQ